MFVVVGGGGSGRSESSHRTILGGCQFLEWGEQGNLGENGEWMAGVTSNNNNNKKFVRERGFFQEGIRVLDDQ